MPKIGSPVIFLNPGYNEVQANNVMPISFVFCSMCKMAEDFRSSWKSQRRQRESNIVKASRITMRRREITGGIKAKRERKKKKKKECRV
jgi:hypothetical protein